MIIFPVRGSAWECVANLAHAVVRGCVGAYIKRTHPRTHCAAPGDSVSGPGFHALTGGRREVAL